MKDQKLALQYLLTKFLEEHIIENLHIDDWDYFTERWIDDNFDRFLEICKMVDE